MLQKSIQFSLDLIKYCENLEAQRKFIIARQLLRSGTSIGANISEAQNPHSKADFVLKMKIAAKEMEETKYWLYLCKNSESYPYDIALENQIIEIGKLLYKTLSTCLSKQKPF